MKGSLDPPGDKAEISSVELTTLQLQLASVPSLPLVPLIHTLLRHNGRQANSRRTSQIDNLWRQTLSFNKTTRKRGLPHSSLLSAMNSGAGHD